MCLRTDVRCEGAWYRQRCIRLVHGAQRRHGNRAIVIASVVTAFAVAIVAAIIAAIIAAYIVDGLQVYLCATATAAAVICFAPTAVVDSTAAAVATGFGLAVLAVDLHEVEERVWLRWRRQKR